MKYGEFIESEERYEYGEINLNVEVLLRSDEIA